MQCDLDIASGLVSNHTPIFSFFGPTVSQL